MAPDARAPPLVIMAGGGARFAMARRSRRGGVLPVRVGAGVAAGFGGG
jgi:hypothetical protein